MELLIISNSCKIDCSAGNAFKKNVTQKVFGGMRYNFGVTYIRPLDIDLCKMFIAYSRYFFRILFS